MAIVGLHNVPIVGPSFLRDSQSTSSRNHGDRGRMSNRASPILQMWRELEDECLMNRGPERVRSRVQRESSDCLPNSPVGEDSRGSLEELGESENGSVDNLDMFIGPMNENVDRHSITSEQSQDIGEVERVRVRQIFQEWMNSGGTSRATNLAHINQSSSSQLLDETERERVRVVREWIQIASQQGEGCVRNREEQGTEVGSQIERVRDGRALDHNEGQGESRRREVRRLCGRPALLGLLAKNQEEIRVELRGLKAARPVSNFAYRNRIQSFLRLRSFQNSTLAELSRSNSAAENELGLLRQRHTVSDLREGFLSRLDSFSHVQTSDNSVGPSYINHDGIRNDQGQFQLSNAVEGHACTHGQDNHDGDSNVSSFADLHQSSDHSAVEFASEESVFRVDARLDEMLHNDEDIGQESSNNIGHLNASSEDGRPMLNSEEQPSSIENGEFGDREQNHEVFGQQYNSLRLEISDVSEDVNVQELSVPIEQSHQVVEDETIDQEHNVISNRLRDDELVEADQHDGEDLFSDAVGNYDARENDAQDDYWNENSSQMSSSDWLDTPSSSISDDEAFYYSTQYHVPNFDLRVLMNRRRVSGLLHSGFRANLDQVLQSRVGRQPPPPATDDQEQLGSDDNPASSVIADGSQTVFTAPLRAPQVRTQIRRVSWSRNGLLRPPRTECDAINDLRSEVAIMQQRLNNMQNMLETCMDMQLELQRSVRQEVSAALNRSMNPSEPFDNILCKDKDSSRWDCVRKGFCCMCSKSTIDSLLYRCGHMCTCTECGNKLVKSNGKCPMCQAPVMEIIRPYFIQ